MGKGTSIQWCDDTVNPTTGCDGCELHQRGKNGRKSCYAGTLHESRLAKAIPELYAENFTEVRLAPGRMAQALAARDLTGTVRTDKPWLNGLPRMIFVGDMSDIFSSAVRFHYIKTECVDGALSRKGRRHIQMWLTKRANGAVDFADWLKDLHGMDWPENIWQGTSITNTTTMHRAALLADHPAKFKFLSIEPLIESIQIDPDLLSQFQLVIVGGESGPDARPFNLDWARSIRDQCERAGVPYFLKQLGYRATDERNGLAGHGLAVHPDAKGLVSRRLNDPHGGDESEWPPDLQGCRAFPKVEVGR